MDQEKNIKILTKILHFLKNKKPLRLSITDFSKPSNISRQAVWYSLFKPTKGGIVSRRRINHQIKLLDNAMEAKIIQLQEKIREIELVRKYMYDKLRGKRGEL